VELNYDGQPCTTEAPGSGLQGTVCTHLELTRDASGGFVGSLYRESSGPNPPRVAGPFASAMDPNVGYPTEVQPEQYGFLRDFSTDVRYRILDGAVRDGALSFFVAPLDLWDGWCQMQTSFPWVLGERREYRCVPQTATEADTDPGKLALCVSVDDLARCDELPCACLDETGQFNFGIPMCSLAYCECSSSGCRADTNGTSVTATLSLDGDTLKGFIAFDTHFRSAITMKKVTP
jgi:hypothetical protein